MEITEKDLMTNYSWFYSVGPSWSLLLGTPVLGTKRRSTKFLLEVEKGKGAGSAEASLILIS